MAEFQTTIELPVRIEYEVHPGCQGRRDRFGAPEEPDFAPDVEIISILSPALDLTAEGGVALRMEELPKPALLRMNRELTQHACACGGE